MSGARFAMISDWMVDGNIVQFVKAYPDVDQPGFASTRLESQSMSKANLDGDGLSAQIFEVCFLHLHRPDCPI